MIRKNGDKYILYITRFLVNCIMKGILNLFCQAYVTKEEESPAQIRINNAHISLKI